jgi:uncharacterized protein (DUF2141 family)
MLALAILAAAAAAQPARPLPLHPAAARAAPEKYPSLPEITQNDLAHCAAGRPGLQVEITGLKARDGEIRVELYPDHDPDFLSDKDKLIYEGKTFRRIIFHPPDRGPVTGCLPIPAPGRYSVAIIHDRNADRHFNWRQDGVAFPGNPHLGLGKPPARKAWVTVGEGVTKIAVTMQYYNGFLSIGPVKDTTDDR